MPPLLFDENSAGCSLPPFNAVSNSLFFFRVNVFEQSLPLEALTPDDQSGVATGRPQTGVARLGLPITDVFPDLLPEFVPSLPTIGKTDIKARLRQGVFLPANSLNKVYSDARLIGATAPTLQTKRIAFGGRQINIPDDKLNKLAEGNPVSLVADGTLVRVLPPARASTDSPPPAGGLFARAFSRPIVPGARLPSLSALSDGSGKNKLEPPRYEIGFISEYEQIWDLTGYSRGGLVSSLTLAPQEELTIEVFTWDRSKLEDERDQTNETQRSDEATSMARVSAQLSGDLTETTDKKANIGLGAPLPIGPVTIDAQGQASVSDNLVQSIKSTVDTISESTRKASEQFKSTTQVKVTQTRETGSETRVTRHIRNPNLGRSLTVHCFEVMEHYRVTTKLLRADKFVLLVEIPQRKTFDILFVLAQEEKLQRALLAPNFLPGFDAAKKLLAQQYFDLRSKIKAEIEAAQAKARGDGAPPADPPIVTIARDMQKKLAKLIGLNLIQKITTLANAYLPGNSISQKDRADAEDALGCFNFWLKFKTVTPGIDSRAQDFNAAIPTGTMTAQDAYDALSALVTGIDDQWLTSVKMLAASLVAAQLAFTLITPFPWLAPVLLEFAMIENDLGLPALIDRAKQAVRAFEVTLQQPPAPTNSNNDNGQKLMPPPQLFSLQELSLADAEFRKLALHLEANRVYYLNSLFAQQDVNLRYETLVALGVQSFVENRLLGFLGRRAIFPLLVQNLEAEARTYLKEELTETLSDQLVELEPAVEDVTLPTSGLHMEPVLGQCDALEPYLVATRDNEIAAAQAQLALAQARTAQVGIENSRRQLRLDDGDLSSP